MEHLSGVPWRQQRQNVSACEQRVLAKPEMLKYFRDLHGDWLALDLGEAAAIRELNQRYGVQGIPKLVAVQPDGAVIDANAREQVQSRGPRAFDAWRKSWKPPAFSGSGDALGGGPGVSRLVAAPEGGQDAAAVLAQFMAFTGIDDEAAARAVLDQAGGNVRAAVQRFFSGGYSLNECFVESACEVLTHVFRFFAQVWF